VEPWNPNATANPAAAQRLILKGTASGRENRNPPERRAVVYAFTAHYTGVRRRSGLVVIIIIMPELPGQCLFLFGNIHLDVRMLTFTRLCYRS